MSCQDVCIEMYYDACTDFYTEKHVCARKPHRCCECDAAIVVGERHQYAAGKSEGDFWQARTCAACEEIRRIFCCGSWVFGELWESIRDQLFLTWNEMRAIDCLARLETQGAIDKMRAQHAQFQENQA